MTTLSYLGDLCASLVGVVLLVSAVAKLRDPQRFARDVSNYEVVPARLNRPVAWLIITAEPAIGLGLLLVIAPSVSLPAAIALLASFAAAVSINLVRKRRIACGCFGGDELIDRGTIFRLTALIGLVFIAWGSRVALAPPSVEVDLGITIARTSTAALVVTALSWASRKGDLRRLTLHSVDHVETAS